MKKQILIFTLCMTLLVLQLHPVIASATENTSGNSEKDKVTDEENNDFLYQFSEQLKKDAEEKVKERAKEEEEKAKKQEDAIANISSLLTDENITSNIIEITLENQSDNVIAFEFTGDTSKFSLYAPGGYFESNYTSGPIDGGAAVSFYDSKYGTVRTYLFFVNAGMDYTSTYGGAINIKTHKYIATDIHGKSFEGELRHNTYKKYSKFVNDIESKINEKILYPECGYVVYGYAVTNSDLMTTSNKKVLAKLAVDYGICKDNESTTTKAILAASTYYGLINTEDNLYVYDKEKSSNISRIEYYTLLSRFFHGYVDIDTLLKEKTTKEWKAEKLSKTIGTVKYTAVIGRRINRFEYGQESTKKELMSPITKMEVILDMYHCISSASGNKKESITDYCTDIKKNQITTWEELEQKYGVEYLDSEKAARVCIKNKLVPVFWEYHIIQAIKDGVLVKDSKGKLNLFSQISDSQAITYLYRFMKNEPYIEF